MNYVNPVLPVFLLALLSGPVETLTLAAAEPSSNQKQTIQKLGTIDLDLVETTPVVFKDRLYRFESVRKGYHGNKRGVPYFRFVDTASGEYTPAFGEGHDLGSAYAESGRMYVFAPTGWGSSKINMFTSSDLKTWEQSTALHLAGWELFNTSVCKAGDRYIMAFEVGGPREVTGQPFTARFAESKDLKTWKLLPEPAVYTKEKYSACPTIRWFDGWFYMKHLENIGGYRFATHLVRSRDLVKWEVSPQNPVITFDEHDKRIASDKLTAEQVKKIKKATNANNSDIDYCEYQGKVIVNYSWGNQKGVEFLAEARYNGSLKEFLTNRFQKPDQDKQS